MKKKNSKKVEVELTDAQINFCETFLSTQVKYSSYLKAFPGVTKATACSSASRLLKKPAIIAYLRNRRSSIKKNYRVSSNRIIKQLINKASFDPRELIDPETGEYYPLELLPKEVAANVTGRKISYTRDGDQIIELTWGAGSVEREALIKILGMYEKDNKQQNEGIVSAADVLKSVIKDMSDNKLSLPSRSGSTDD